MAVESGPVGDRHGRPGPDRVSRAAAGAGGPARRPPHLGQDREGRVRPRRPRLHGRPHAGAPARVADLARHRAPRLLGRQHDLGERRRRPRSGARFARGRLSRLRQSARPLRRAGGAARTGCGRRAGGDRVGHQQGARPFRLGARLHRPGRRGRRRGHRLPVGSPGPQGQVPRLGRQPRRPQLQLARLDPFGRRLVRARHAGALRRRQPRHAHDGHDGR